MKKTLHTLLLLLCTQFSHAQKLIIDWTRFIGGDSCYVQAMCCVTNNNGEIVFSGATNCNNKGDIPATSLVGSNVIVGKYTASRQLAWVKQFGGSGGENAHGICASVDGGYAIIATTTSSDGDITGAIGSSDVLVVKMDEQGNKIWASTFGSFYAEGAVSITACPDSGFIILATSNGSGDDVPSHYTTSQFVEDWLVIKIDKAGNKQWAKSLGGDGDEVSSGKVLYARNGYYLVSSSKSKDHECFDTSWQHGLNTGYDIFVIRMDLTGNIEWTKSYGSSMEDVVNDAFFDTRDSSILIGGYTAGNDFIAHGNHGGRDALTIKLDKEGMLIWSTLLGSVNNEDYQAIAVGPMNTYALYTSTVQSIFGKEDGWIFILDTNGKEISSKLVGGDDDDRVVGTSLYKNGIALVNESRSQKYAEGTTEGQFIHSTKAAISYLYYFPTSVDMLDKLQPLEVYPNPTSTAVKIHFPVYGTFLSVENAEGHKLLNVGLRNDIDSKEISVAAWYPGVYIISFRSNDGKIYHSKFVKY